MNPLLHQDSELVAGVAGLLLSLAGSRFPGLSRWYSRQADDIKQLVMAIAVVIAGVVSAAVACGDPQSAAAAAQACQEGLTWSALVRCLLAAVVANQSTHSITNRITKKLLTRSIKPKNRRSSS